MMLTASNTSMQSLIMKSLFSREDIDQLKILSKSAIMPQNVPMMLVLINEEFSVFREILFNILCSLFILYFWDTNIN